MLTFLKAAWNSRLRHVCTVFALAVLGFMDVTVDIISLQQFMRTPCFCEYSGVCSAEQQVAIDMRRIQKSYNPYFISLSDLPTPYEQPVRDPNLWCFPRKTNAAVVRGGCKPVFGPPSNNVGTELQDACCPDWLYHADGAPLSCISNRLLITANTTGLGLGHRFLHFGTRWSFPVERHPAILSSFLKTDGCQHESNACFRCPSPRELQLQYPNAVWTKLGLSRDNRCDCYVVYPAAPLNASQVAVVEQPRRDDCLQCNPSSGVLCRYVFMNISTTEVHPVTLLSNASCIGLRSFENGADACCIDGLYANTLVEDPTCATWTFRRALGGSNPVYLANNASVCNASTCTSCPDWDAVGYSWVNIVEPLLRNGTLTPQYADGYLQKGSVTNLRFELFNGRASCVIRTLGKQMIWHGYEYVAEFYSFVLALFWIIVAKEIVKTTWLLLSLYHQRHRYFSIYVTPEALSEQSEAARPSAKEECGPMLDPKYLPYYSATPLALPFLLFVPEFRQDAITDSMGPAGLRCHLWLDLALEQIPQATVGILLLLLGETLTPAFQLSLVVNGILLSITIVLAASGLVSLALQTCRGCSRGTNTHLAESEMSKHGSAARLTEKDPGTNH